MNDPARPTPVLETARLRLRPYRAGDLEAQAAILADPQVTRYLGGTPLSREDAWRRLLCGPSLWTLLGYGYWAVERLEGGSMIGFMGFADFKRDMAPSIDGLPEMGWIFAPEAQGQGYCTEAVRAGLAWADETLKGEKIVAIINPDNLPSIRVAERCGFSGRQEATYRGEPILLFTRPPNSPEEATL
ncbi:MAG TPA: GNAT family N-acetyltransferase [Allosphingosinicella sp.]|nr:GNAT family N-acetyltransferase [Allosphingosinicella sp.]